MDCQRCGKHDALVHLTEINEGQVRSLWLCPACARARQNGLRGHGESDHNLFGDGEGEEFHPGAEEDPLDSFLGADSLRRRQNDRAVIRTCPVCGFQIETYFRLNRLGCAGCYRAFASNIRPLLAHHHGRTIHLGKVPPANPQGQNPLAEMTRARVALEKAVAVEDFEEAARLRDHLKTLQGRQNRPGPTP